MINLLHSLLEFFSGLGYGGIFALMTIESSFIPFPSEIVMPPAGYLAAQGQMNFGLAVLAGTAGSVLGALINYFLARWLGRKVVHRLARTKLAHYLLITEEKIIKSETYFRQYGRSSTFFGRLVPAVRQLISLPAGLARMNLAQFVIYTAMGAAVWNIILVSLGFFFGYDNSAFHNIYQKIALLAVVLFILFILIIIAKRNGKNHQQHQ